MRPIVDGMLAVILWLALAAGLAVPVVVGLPVALAAPAVLDMFQRAARADRERMAHGFQPGGVPLPLVAAAVLVAVLEWYWLGYLRAYAFGDLAAKAIQLQA